MAMYQHFEDVHNLVKEQSCVAELIAMEAMKLTQRVTGTEERKIDAELLRTLTALVVNKLDIDEMRIEYQQRERQREVNQRIDAAAVQRMQANRF
ncbi:TPA: hypothetical protein MX370_002734 [Pseudomonas aeruginosa]|nr:hypothetical protein [Pseudomonas aeruginosa]MDV6815319.1 hypothetical protein [Pseudomonas aeruginosa]HBO5256675.1 hypothetical protein [Pseudomonas aeruginosa]HCA7624905.1 hypothetical protein [Pseudomonas aeruginosa]HCA7761929.1 hypothetical protein [Pseudomonas aeruginosa]